MLIGEIVRQTGVSRDTIRHYEKLGLLKTEGRPSAFNNYKSYPPATVTRLALIQQGKDLGFTLTEIADGLGLWEKEGISPAELQVRITKKLAAVKEKIQQLKALRGRLRHSLDELEARRCATGAGAPTPANCPAATAS